MHYLSPEIAELTNQLGSKTLIQQSASCGIFQNNQDDEYIQRKISL